MYISHNKSIKTLSFVWVLKENVITNHRVPRWSKPHFIVPCILFCMVYLYSFTCPYNATKISFTEINSFFKYRSDWVELHKYLITIIQIWIRYHHLCGHALDIHTYIKTFYLFPFDCVFGVFCGAHCTQSSWHTGMTVYIQRIQSY